MFCVVVVPICFNFLSSLNTVSFIAGQQLQLLTLVSYGTCNGQVQSLQIEVHSKSLRNVYRKNYVCKINLTCVWKFLRNVEQWIWQGTLYLIGIGLKCGKHVAEFFYQQAAVNLISLKVISQDIHPLGAFHLSIICVFPTFMCICPRSGPIWR